MFDKTKIPELKGLEPPLPDENYGLQSKTFNLMLDVYNGYIPANLDWPKTLFTNSQDFILIGNMAGGYLDKLWQESANVSEDHNGHPRSIRTYARYLCIVIRHYRMCKEKA